MDSSETLGGKSNGGLPNITGDIWPYSSMGGDAYGAFEVYAGNNTATRGSGGGWGYKFNASRCSAVYDNGITVRPAHTTMNYCVKY